MTDECGRPVQRRRRAPTTLPACRLALGAGICLAALGSAGALAWSARAGTPRAAPPLAALARFHVGYAEVLHDRPGLVRGVTIGYRSHAGSRRRATIVLPSWYGPRRHPALPLVISPHGRGLSVRANLRFWGSLPAFGPFALISPEGQGRRERLYSWGWRGQIDDLARMPALAARAVPWLRIDRRRIFAVGSSMGGQEVLLLVAQHPHLLAAAAALDSATNMAARYRAFPHLRRGRHLQALARREIGGTPRSDPAAYRQRSPLADARLIAHSPTRLLIWWSRRDRIVRDQARESGALYRAIRAAVPRASVSQHVGSWAHSREFSATAQLPLILARLGLIRLAPPAAGGRCEVAGEVACEAPRSARRTAAIALPPT